MTQDGPAKIPENWEVSEKDIDAAWDKKNRQFAEFKKYFSDLFKSNKANS